MNATQLSTTPGGPPVGTSTLTVRTPAAGPRPGVFRETLYVRLAPGEGAEELLVDAGACLASAAFQVHSYDAIPSGAGPLRAGVVGTSDGKGLVVTLDAPRRVRHLDVTHPPVGGYTVELYRMDGDTPADSPSATGFELDPRDLAFEVMFDGPAMMALAGGSSIHGGAAIGLASPGFTVDLTDRRFMVRLRGPGGTLASVSPASLTSLTVESYPTNPRIGIAFPAPGPPFVEAQPEEASIFWRAPGEIGRETPIGAGAVAAGEALGAEVGRAAARFAALLADAAPGSTLPATLDVALVVESDAPCRLRLDSFRVAYSLARESFPDGAEKQVLRFAPGMAESREIPIVVPTGVSVLSASVALTESLRGDLPGSASGGLAAGLAGRTGVRVHPERRAAQRFTPVKAVTSSGAVVAVLPLAAGAAARLELRADADGSPSGRKLGEGVVSLPLPGHPGWAVVRFAEPVILSSTPHWLVLSCGSGAVVWLTSEGEGPEPVRTLAGDVATALPGATALHDVLSPGDPVAASPLTLSLGDHPVSPGEVVDGRRGHDVAPALAAFLAEHPGASGVLTAPLRCTALGPGSVTAYPPRIVFERP